MLSARKCCHWLLFVIISTAVVASIAYAQSPRDIRISGNAGANSATTAITMFPSSTEYNRRAKRSKKQKKVRKKKAKSDKKGAKLTMEMPSDTTASADELVELLQLESHPEGGSYRETFRDTTQIKWVSHSALSDESRDATSAMYYLVKKNSVNSFHQIDGSEVWHFYHGECPLIIHQLIENNDALHSSEYEMVILGNNVTDGEKPQAHVRGPGTWVAAELADPDCSYALVGRTFAPGFEYVHWQIADRSKLSMTFPNYEDLISRLTYF